MSSQKIRLEINEYKSEFNFERKSSKLVFLFNRAAFIFFIFVIISLIFSIKIFYYGSMSNFKTNNSLILKNDFRADIIDRSGNILAKTVLTKNVGINPNKVKDKKKFLLKLKLIFPEKNFGYIKKQLKNSKFFYLEKKISTENLEKIKLLGEKAFIYETKISRIYPFPYLFSHTIGQIDEDNIGISGLEKSHNKNLTSEKLPLQLTLDTNIQFLIREELLKANSVFQTVGSAAILMDVNSGEIISMVSTPDYDLNKRVKIDDDKFINRVTKGVYEFGSVFKTFTLAAGLNYKDVNLNTNFQNLPKIIYCAGRPIREYDENIPKNLTAEEILIRSGNIGSVRIAQKIGEKKYSSFLKKIGILNRIEFELEEMGTPLPIKWGKCKLATSSFGHGITTTILQLAKGYSILSNGGYDVKPTIIKKTNTNKIKKKDFK